MRAFWTFPESVHLLPDEDRRRRVLPRYLASDALDAADHGVLMGAEVDGTLVGAAAWLPPEAYPLSLARQVRQLLHVLPVAPWAIGAAREARRGQEANRAPHRARPPHYWLRAVGVDPAWQGRGVGTELIRPVLDRADHERRGAYLLTATPGNVTWYEGLGFSTVAAFRPTPRWPQVWAMWREPTG